MQQPQRQTMQAQSSHGTLHTLPPNRWNQHKRGRRLQGRQRQPRSLIRRACRAYPRQRSRPQRRQSSFGTRSCTWRKSRRGEALRSSPPYRTQPVGMPSAMQPYPHPIRKRNKFANDARMRSPVLQQKVRSQKGNKHDGISSSIRVTSSGWLNSREACCMPSRHHRHTRRAKSL